MKPPIWVTNLLSFEFVRRSLIASFRMHNRFPLVFGGLNITNARMNLTPAPRGRAFTWKKSTPPRRVTRPEETGCPPEWGPPPRM